MNKREADFIAQVWRYYEAYGRHHLPWRKTRNPYRILISEVMLQQTQVARVLPKYQAFLRTFPTLEVLAAAPLKDVLQAWQGLGYNRRAIALQRAAQCIVREHKGKFPRTYAELLALPGVGPYTAGAILAFVYNRPVPVIETNIRRVYLHHFFRGKEQVSDAELLPIITRTLSSENPRAWYVALMDYGAFLKAEYGNANVRSKHYTKQAAFKGSTRQLRGAILRTLINNPKGATAQRIQAESMNFPTLLVKQQLQVLVGEGFVAKRGAKFVIP